MLYSQVVPYTSTPETIAQVGRLLQDNTGQVTFASLERSFTGGVRVAAGDVNGSGPCCPATSMGDGSVRGILRLFWYGIRDDMQLGAYGEKWDQWPGVPAPRAAGSSAVELFSIASLTRLTSWFAFGDTFLQTQRNHLARAQSAIEAGDRTGAQTALRSYMDGLDAGATANAPAVNPVSVQSLKALTWAAWPW